MTGYVKRDLRYAVGEPYGTEPIKILCPNPDHEERTPSYAVYADGAYCFGCGYQERPREFLARLGKQYEQLPARTLPERSLHGTNGGAVDEGIRGVSREVDTYLWHHHDTLVSGPCQSRCEWFTGRGFTDDDIRRFRFGHTGSHFVIPVWYGKTITGYKKRVDPESLPDGRYPKYQNPRGQSTLIVRPSPNAGVLAIVEGELDAYYLQSFGVDTITTTTGARSLPKRMEELFRSNAGRPDELYVMVDQDSAGQQAAEAIAASLPNRTRRCRWDRGSDISEYLLGFPVEERYEAVKELIQNADAS
jgi:hypothetical protein